MGQSNQSEIDKKIKSIRPEVIRESDTSVRPDGNNVDIDREMSLLAENALEYNLYISLLSKKVEGLLSVINEGRR